MKKKQHTYLSRSRVRDLEQQAKSGDIRRADQMALIRDWLQMDGFAAEMAKEIRSIVEDMSKIQK
jgi:hypothetical protein